jgi:hypothetical protein
MNEQIHKINEINVVNPELANLISKAEVIHLITGGKIVNRSDKKKLSNYKMLKEEIKAKIDNINNINERLESGLYDKDSRDYISMKNTLRSEYTLLSDSLDKFKNESKKSKNSDPIEVKEQEEIYIQVKNIIPKHRQSIQNKDHEGPINTIEDLLSGKLTRQKQEQITSSQQEIIIEIDNETKIQDDILDIMSKNVENLDYLAKSINDTVQTQNEIIENTIAKTKNADTMVSNVGIKTKNLVKKINSKSSKICTYIICIAILLALVLFLYNIMK